MQLHPFTNFENDLRFNGVYSSDNLPNKIKDGTYERNLDEYVDIGTQSIALHANCNTSASSNVVTYFDSFGVKHFLKGIKKIQRQQKHHNRYLQNKSIRLSNR